MNRSWTNPRGSAAALLCVVALALCALPAAAQKREAAAPIQGTVLRVIDGDTLVLQVAERAPIDVRLRDMDAPELCQAHGPEAKKALEEMALGKAATLVTAGRDSFGRTIGSLTIDGQNLAARMVQEGHGWSVRYRYDNGPLVKQERQAKALGRGLHATAGAVMPRDFRKNNGPCPAPPKS